MAEDIQLLRRFAENRAEDAFRALVERHVSFVYAAALRQLAGAAHRAEDVTQTVFLHLAQRAATLARRQDIVGWLYITTHHVASELKRTEVRRQRREQEAHLMHELSSNSSAHTDWERLRPVLDGALLELSERDRQAVLLRFFKNEGFAEIGRELGVSEDGARMRVERALDKLHALLAKRGITSPSAALGVALANQAIVAAPAGLAANIVSSAMSGAAAAASAGSLVTAIYFMHASKIAVSVGVAAVLASGVAIYQISRANRAQDELAQARAEHLIHARRLTSLEKSAVAVETEVAERQAALERIRLAKASDAAAAVRQAAAREENAKQAKALQQFLSNDPEYRRLSLAAAREDFIWGDAGWYLRSIGLTPAQIEQAADLRNEIFERRFALIGGGQQLREPASFNAHAAVARSPRFRAMFGDAAAEGLASFNDSFSSVVTTFALKQICRDHFYQDDPFTLQQVQRLRVILMGAQTEAQPTAPSMVRYDWDRVLRETEPIMSPAQMNTLRAYAAKQKADLVWSQAEEIAAKTAKK